VGVARRASREREADRGRPFSGPPEPPAAAAALSVALLSASAAAPNANAANAARRLSRSGAVCCPQACTSVSAAASSLTSSASSRRRASNCLRCRSRKPPSAASSDATVAFRRFMKAGPGGAAFAPHPVAATSLSWPSWAFKRASCSCSPRRSRTASATNACSNASTSDTSPGASLRTP
jgi:hypothetical protein